MRTSIFVTSAALVLVTAIACADATSPIPFALPVPAGANDAEWADIGRTCGITSPAWLLSGERADSLPAVGAFPNLDGKLAAAARVVPGGFGGLWVQDNVLTFYLVDTTEHAAAASALSSSGLTAGEWNWSVTNVLPGRWDFAQLYDWYRYLDQHVWTVPGMALSDIDEAKNRIHYGVADAQSRAALEALLKKLDVPCYLVAIQEGVVINARVPPPNRGRP
jgi:hypothetical protein